MDTTFVGSLRKILRQNVREYGMYIALVVIMAVFNWVMPLIKPESHVAMGTFLSSRNISDLINQMGYIAVIAVGMTLVIVIRHIDLSVGFLAGFLGAVAAIVMVSLQMSWIVAIFVVLLGGILA